MINIYEYLLGKNTKMFDTNVFPNDFCLVVAYNEMYRKMCKEWEDALMHNKIGPDVFVVPTSAVEKYFDNKDFEAYKIPDDLDDMNTLERELDLGEFDVEEIEKLN